MSVILFFVLPAFINQSEAEVKHFKTLDRGLEFGELQSPERSVVGDSIIRILRIDPKYYEFDIAMASATQSQKNKSVRSWVREKGYVAGINASMYQQDLKTSVSMMRSPGHINNGHLSSDRSLFVFGRGRLPRMLDRDCDSVKNLKEKYGFSVQSIRMISCLGKNVWSRSSKKKWSHAVLAIDRSRRILLIHSRSPYTTYDFIHILKNLPLEIDRAMYLEGGPQAQLVIETSQGKEQWLGSYATGYHEHNLNFIAWPVPNIIGIREKK